MSDVKERLKEMMFELGDLKAKAKTFEDHELADASLTALRAKWEAYCKKQLIVFKEVI